MSSNELEEKFIGAVEGEIEDLVSGKIGGKFSNFILKLIPHRRIPRLKFNIGMFLLYPIIIFSGTFLFGIIEALDSNQTWPEWDPILRRFYGRPITEEELSFAWGYLWEQLFISFTAVFFASWAAVCLFRWRLNDLGKDITRTVVGAGMLGPSLFILAGQFFPVFHFIGLMLALAICLPMNLMCIFKRGKRGPNQYGEEPLI